MATVYKYLVTSRQYYGELQIQTDIAESRRRRRFFAVVLLQRMTRGYLIRKHIAWLSRNAIIIQCAFRMHRARKIYRAKLMQAVRNKHAKYYAVASTRIQALWRGFASRRKLFCYLSYRRWLARVCQRGEKRLAEAAEFRIKSRADDLKILEEEATHWLAFVIFKLHHLVRTTVCAGIYSNPATTELSEFEQLLKAIRYTEYMNRLRRKYDEFVRKHRPHFSNKRLFPVIGDGADYWYLSLAEMYEMTALPPPTAKADPRHLAKHHGSLHAHPFLWKGIREPKPDEGRGPFKTSRVSCTPPAPAPTPAGYTTSKTKCYRDPRFHLYVKYYRPQPDVFDYVDFHINVIMKRKSSIEKLNT